MDNTAVLGIEIDNDNIKLALVNKHQHNYSLIYCENIALLPHCDLATNLQIACSCPPLKKNIFTKYLFPHKAAIGINEDLVIRKTIYLNRHISKAEILQEITQIFNYQSIFSPANWQLNAIFYPHVIENNINYPALIIATPKKVTCDLAHLLKKANLKPQLIDLNSHALTSLLYRAHQTVLSTNNYCLINISQTSVAIVFLNTTNLNNIVPHQWHYHEFYYESYATLCSQLTAQLLLYQTLVPTLQQYLLTGSCAFELQPKLACDLMQATKCQGKLLDFSLIFNNLTGEENNLNNFSIAIGLAIRALN